MDFGINYQMDSGVYFSNYFHWARVVSKNSKFLLSLHYIDIRSPLLLNIFETSLFILGDFMNTLTFEKIIAFVVLFSLLVLIIINEAISSQLSVLLIILFLFYKLLHKITLFNLQERLEENRRYKVYFILLYYILLPFLISSVFFENFMPIACYYWVQTIMVLLALIVFIIIERVE